VGVTNPLESLFEETETVFSEGSYKLDEILDQVRENLEEFFGAPVTTDLTEEAGIYFHVGFPVFV
jgi:hypothetical protein